MKTKKIVASEVVHKDEAKERLIFSATHTETEFFDTLNTSINGLTDKQIESSKEKYGNNIVAHGRKNPLLKEY